MDERTRIAEIFNREIMQAEDDIEPTSRIEWLKGLRDEILAETEDE